MTDASVEKKARTSVRAVIDRIEDGGLAVLLLGDDEQVTIDVPLDVLPAGAGGGDHLLITFALDGGSRAETEKRVKGLREKLERRGGGGGGTEFKL